MNRIFAFIAVSVFSISATFAQTAEEVIAKFEEKTNIKNIDPKKRENISTQITMSSMGMDIPVLLIKSGEGKIRLEMTAAGQNVIMVLNGDDSFMVIPGQGVQDVPASTIKSQGKMGDMLSKFTFNRPESQFKLGAEENGSIVIEEYKAKNLKKPIATYYFNKATGLLEKSVERNEGVNTTIVISEYKQFGDVYMPSSFETKAAGQTAVIKINALELDCPILPYMFARPN